MNLTLKNFNQYKNEKHPFYLVDTNLWAFYALLASLSALQNDSKHNFKSSLLLLPAFKPHNLYYPTHINIGFVFNFMFLLLWKLFNILTFCNFLFTKRVCYYLCFINQKNVKINFK